MSRPQRFLIVFLSHINHSYSRKVYFIWGLATQDELGVLVPYSQLTGASAVADGTTVQIW